MACACGSGGGMVAGVTWRAWVKGEGRGMLLQSSCKKLSPATAGADAAVTAAADAVQVHYRHSQQQLRRC